MTGDQYQVFYCVAGNTTPHPLGPWDSWRDAKLMRDESFLGFPEVQACWVMRSTWRRTSSGTRCGVG